MLNCIRSSLLPFPFPDPSPCILWSPYSLCSLRIHFNASAGSAFILVPASVQAYSSTSFLVFLLACSGPVFLRRHIGWTKPYSSCIVSLSHSNTMAETICIIIITVLIKEFDVHLITVSVIVTRFILIVINIFCTDLLIRAR